MKLIREVAISLVGVPYKWGGATPAEGLDCGGLVQILLEVGGADPPGDQTAQALFDHFSKNVNHLGRNPQLGALVFYGSGPRAVTHVAMCIDKRRMIEAAGGGSNTKSREDAIRDRASVRIVPVRLKDLLGFYLPEYPAAETE